MTSHIPNIPGYDVEAEIGRGGMGVVYKGRRLTDGKTLAIKMILHNRKRSFVELARFRIEVEALTCLNHPNIVKIRDVGLYQGNPYFALEFAERGSLRQVIASGPQSPRSTAELVRTLALAMQHAHERGMLHRDLKPANVLLMADGTPLVSDFGLVKFANPLREVSEAFCTMNVGTTLDHELTRYARELGAQYKTVGDAQSISEDEITHAMWQQCASRTGVLGDGSRLRSVREFLSEAHEQSQAASSGLDGLDGLTNSGAVMGSLNYMAPEQALGNLADIGPWTDVYALGGILYELLTGQTPNRANSLMERIIAWADSIPAISPRQLTPDLSRDLEAVCLKCLEKRSNSRYQSAADLAEDLTRFLDGYSPRLATAGNRIEPTLPTNTGEVISTVESDAPTPPDQHPVTKSWWPFGRKRSKAPQ